MAARAYQVQAAAGDRQLIAGTILVRVVQVAADVAAGGAIGDCVLRTGGPNGEAITPTLRTGAASTTVFFDFSNLDGLYSDGLFFDIGTVGTGVTWWVWLEELGPRR